jgi:hypothetical protein
MSGPILAWLFVGISVVSTTIQGSSWHKLRRLPRGEEERERRVYGGMVRTAVCRVVAAGAYVAFGVTSLAVGALPVLALIVFAGIQVMWQLNAVADVRLRRWLARNDHTGGTD